MKRRKVKEIVGGKVYEYVPFGKYVVYAPDVCRGGPTFKYTRIEVTRILKEVASGIPRSKLLAKYEGRISQDAISEAFSLAAKAFVDEVKTMLRSRRRNGR
jgi:uncharacterized protein (DUF433 family)